jgi:hypothetical protein
MSVYALVGGSNFRGGWKVYQSQQDAGRFVTLLEKLVPGVIITTLFDRQYTRTNILSEVRQMAETLTSDDTLIMYFAGHGTQVRDRDGEESDGMDEALQTDDFQTVIDDELTLPFVDAYQLRDAAPKLISIADTCHSPSFDMWRFDNTPVHAISIKAALDHQSALQSGEGSYMSYFLFDILAHNPDITVRQLEKKLTVGMVEGFAGQMQLCLISVSNQLLWDIQILK